jgi:hypothetical protein
MPVYILQEEMPYEEFCKWMRYFELRPPEWRAADRAFKLVQTQGFKGKPWEIFRDLLPIYNPPNRDGFNVQAFKSSYLFHKLLSAQGGDKLDFDNEGNRRRTGEDSTIESE